jgi:hypothetical protein
LSIAAHVRRILNGVVSKAFFDASFLTYRTRSKMIKHRRPWCRSMPGSLRLYIRLPAP